MEVKIKYDHCKICGTLFKKRNTRHLCCSKDCSDENQREIRNKACRKYRLKNREICNEYRHEYHLKHREKRCEYTRKRTLRYLTAYNEFLELGLVKPVQTYREKYKTGVAILQELQNKKGNDHV